MSGLLEGHIAAVTGGGSGIGRAISLGYEIDWDLVQRKHTVTVE